MVIIANCVVLALNHPLKENRGQDIAEHVFTAVYTVEMVLKIFARGFALHRYAYLRDPWNRLDLLIVILGFITFIHGPEWLVAIRGFRVLRAIKVISVIQGLRRALNTMLQSVVMLGNVLFIFTFFLAVTALIGLELFRGDLRNKCVKDVNGTDYDFQTNKSFWHLKDGNPVLCRSYETSSSCPVCKRVGPNPNDGYTGFDNIGLSFLMAFQLLTLDFWENQYNKVLRVKGPWYIFFYIPVVSFGSFFLYNLVLAVVTIAFTKETQDEARNHKRHLRLKRTAPSYDVDNDTLKRLHLLKIDPHTEKLLRLKRQRRLQIQKRKGRRIAARRTWSKHIEYIIENPTNYDKGTRWMQFRLHLYHVVTDNRFELAIIALIAANTIVLGCYHYPIDPNVKNVLDAINQVFTWIFLLEMVFKLVALGPMLYVKDKWNIFDGFVVIISVVDAILELTKVKVVALKNFGPSVFRSLRLLRVLRLAKIWKEMDIVLGAFSKSVGPLASISFFLLLTIFIFAVLGTQLFAPFYTKQVFKQREIPHWNFKDFWHSYMMVFRIICGEWIEPLWTCMWAAGEWAILFILPAFLIGNLIVLNLFVALLLDSFQGFSEDDKNERQSTKKNYFTKLLSKLKTRNKEEIVINKKNKEKSLDPYDLPTTAVDESSTTNSSMRACPASDSKLEVVVEKIDDCLPSCFPLPSRCKTRNNRWLMFRYKVRQLVQHKYFEWAVLLLIFVSSFVLIWDDSYLKNHPKRKMILLVLNFVFCIAFLLEMLLKIIGFGISKYFASAWNWLDAFIVCISVVGLSTAVSSAYRSLRTFRALRPLRAISRLQGMKVIINALFASISGIANVLLVCFVFWVIFSILGVQLFAGKFYKCTDLDGTVLSPDLVQNKSVCCNLNYTWTNSKTNFDNVAIGFLALYQVATYEGWMEIMKDAVDATNVDEQPRPENNRKAYIYFVVFIVIGTFVVFNLFISIIIDNFHKLKSEYDDDIGMFLTENQRKWVALLRTAVKKKPKVTFVTGRPQGWFCGKVFDVVTGEKFEIIMLCIITLNMILMMMEHYGQSEKMSLAILGINIFFTSLYFLEAVVKLSVLRLLYFRSRWNVFDFVILIVSIAGVVAEILLTNKADSIPNPSFLRILRIFRIARLFKFIDRAEGVRKLVVALVISMPSLLNVVMVMFIIVFIYAIIGMSLFGDTPPKESLDDMMNFQDFVSSMLLLFRLTTSAGWNDILDSLSNDCGSSCNINQGECNTNVIPIALYLGSYVLVIFLIMVNMFIAILLESVNSVSKEDEFILGENTVDDFYDVWKTFAPLGEVCIPYQKLSNFAAKLKKPLQIPQPNDMKLFRMKIPLRKRQQVHVFDVMKAIVKYCLEREDQLESPEEFDKIVSKMEIKLYRFQKKTFPRDKPSSKEAAANVIQKAYRAHLRRKRLQDVVEMAKRQTEAFVNPQEFNSLHENGIYSNKHNENLEMKKNQVPANNSSDNNFEIVSAI